MVVYMSYTYGRVHQITPFGVFVRNLRKATGDTVSCMADKLGTTRTRLTQIELGIRSDIVSLYIIKRLNDAYDLTQKEKEELREIAMHCSKDSMRLDFANVSLEDKQDILNYAYSLMLNIKS